MPNPRWMALFDAKALHARLRELPDYGPPSVRTVQRWVTSQGTMRAQDVAAVRRILELPEQEERT